jgi:3-oxoacyl-[acyl-carrier protein] reductase
MAQVEDNRKVIVVTGGGQGIGRAICLHFAARNFSVAVVDKNTDTAQETAQLCKLENVEARAIPCDLTDRAQVRKAFAQIDDAFGRIDVLVNNAGVFIRQTLEHSTDEAIDALLGVNLKGLLDCTRAAIPIMKRRKGGSIVNACSILGDFPDVGLGVYGATKSAVGLLTRVMAGEFAPYGIRVNAYQPAVTDTPMVHHIIVERPGPKLTQIPLRRFGEPTQIAKLVWFLTSDEADYITGQIVPCDGGIWAVQRPMKAYDEAGVKYEPDLASV